MLLSNHLPISLGVLCWLVRNNLPLHFAMPPRNSAQNNTSAHAPGRGGGRTGRRLGTLRSSVASRSTHQHPVASSSRNRLTPSSFSSSDDEETDEEQLAAADLLNADEESDDDDSSDSSSSEQIGTKKTRLPPVILPTKENFHELGLEWGKAKADQVLAGMKLAKSPSADGLFEAQALQAQYNLDKTMLCIAMKCSRRALDEAL